MRCHSGGLADLFILKVTTHTSGSTRWPFHVKVMKDLGKASI